MRHFSKKRHFLENKSLHLAHMKRMFHIRVFVSIITTKSGLSKITMYMGIFNLFSSRIKKDKRFA